MSDIAEGLGTAVEGGLFARALDPKSGAKQRQPDDPDNCLNCGTPLEGAYCHACGQAAHVHRSIGAFMHDLLHGALHFEGKLWRTLPMLVLRPGRLTRRYIEGARARFVSPMALFLFSVFLMFAVFQVLGVTAPTELPVEANLEQSLEEARASAQSELDDIQRELAAGPISEAERADMEERLEILQLFLRENPETALTEIADGLQDGSEEQDPSVRAERSDLSVPETGIGFLDSVAGKWRDNPSLMLYKLQANSYKFSWLLIPISVPFVWLLFAWRRRFGAYDHAIFVTYSLSFMTLLFVTISLLSAVGVGSSLLTGAFLIAVPLHIYRQLRGAYELSRFSSLWRLLVLFIFILIILILFLQALLLLGTF